MKRRLYFLFSKPDQARQAVADLNRLGVDSAHLHVLARPGTDLGDLPPATGRQRRNILKRLDQALRGGNLMLFGLAFAGLFLSAVFGNLTGTLLALAIMIASVAGGALFALRLPTTHLDEFQEAMRHGELLLMVDVSRDGRAAVEDLMRRRYPAAVTGGSAWTPDAFGV